MATGSQAFEALFGVSEPVAGSVGFEDVDAVVSRSSMAPVSRSLPKTSGQFSNGRLVVTIRLVRS